MAVRYQHFLEAISRMTELDFDDARAVGRAALVTLAGQLPGDERRRLLDALSADLRHGMAVSGAPTQLDDVGFVQTVSRLSSRPPEEAWLLTHAAFAALAEEDPGLVRGLSLSESLRELFTQPHPGGGLTGVGGGQAPLTDEEVRAALDQLPYWSGDTNALVRTVELPEENLERVLDRIRLMHQNLGRGPTVRRLDGAADLVVNTTSIGAVTADDVKLAHQVDRTIDEAGAGIAFG